MNGAIIKLPFCNHEYVREGMKILLDGEVRNKCWACDKYFNLKNPLQYEKGQKHYFKCHRCGAVNHL